MRTWTRLVPALLLALPFTLAPIRAADPETTAQKVDRLESELRKLRKDLDDVQDRVVNSSLRRNAVSDDLRRLQERLAILEQMVVRHDDLLKQSITRQSAYGPGAEPAGPGAPPPNGTSTITVQNQYPATATIRINGRPYTVEPYRTATIGGVPLGLYNYEVEVEGYGLVQPLQTETLRSVGRRITIFQRIGG